MPNINPIILSGGGVNYSVNVFTGSGTYTKPANLNHAYVILVSGGAGGGSGRRGAASTNRGGGYASGGVIALAKFNNADLSATTSVTVGAGGNGATGRTTDNTNGGAGTAGGVTNFGGSTFQVSGGASAGGGGSVVTAVSVSGISFNFNLNHTKLILLTYQTLTLGTTTPTIAHRGNGTITANSSTQWLNCPFNSSSVGGAINGTNTRLASGQLAGFYNDAGALTNEIAGTTSGNDGVQPSSFYTFGGWFAKMYPWFNPADANYDVGRGGLGGGCASSDTNTGRSGAAGLGYGAPGGGGGASTNGYTSGAGGAGTSGIVIIINVLN